MDKGASLFTVLDADRKLIGVEVGVWKGDLSIDLLNEFPKLILHMVDLWRPFKPKDPHYPVNIDIMQNTALSDHESIYSQVKKTFGEYGDRAIIKRGDSVRVANQYQDNYFDFVFIDAEHSEGALTSDIDAWWPKIKPGGLLSGHDYNHKHFPGVADAVNKFVEKTGLKLDSKSDTCWFIRKRDD